MKNLCVFCGSSMGKEKAYKIATRKLSNILIKNKFTLIYGGANVGLMKILADTMLENKGEVIGVMPGSLVAKEVAHLNLTKMHIVESMQERKVLMAKISDAFIALPGGFGTLDELAEMLTYNQLRIHDKPLGILNIKGYFDDFISFLNHGVDERFVREEHRNNLIIEEDAEILIERMKEYQPVTLDKWIQDIKHESAT